MDKLIIRTSDRGTFRRCRELWNFTSKIRENWDFVPGVEALDFGTAIHAGLEIYYDPKRWRQDRQIVQNETILAFLEHMDDWRERLKRSEQWDLMEDTWHDHNSLGKGMFIHFFSWAPGQDAFWEPLKAEIEFEVPLPVPAGYKLPPEFYRIDQTLHKRVRIDEYNATFVPVVYQGRIDLIAHDTRTGHVFVWDHKTASQLGNYDHLELDTQASSYAWVLKKILGIDVHGVIFQELRKKAPEKPKVLKSGALSKDKGQNTTCEIYRKTIRELGLNPAEYEPFLEELGHVEQEYFRRIQVDRSATELEIIERHVLNEALDMLSDPYIYPNPSRWNCNGCRFRDPCLMKQDGSDVEYFLKHSLLYEKRS